MRRSAVTACGKLFLHSPEVTTGACAADLLYAQIRDNDPSVVTFAMQTVNFMLKHEGGLIIPNSMAK